MTLRTISLAGALLLGAQVFAQDPSDYDEERMAKACETASNVGADTCRCMASRARAELSEDGFMFVTAAYEKDEAVTATLRSRMPPTDTIAASMFMVSGPAQCAGG